MKQYKDTPYFITESGEIYRDGKKLKPRTIPSGYIRTSFSLNGKVLDKYNHRLVAEVYIPNPNNLPQVNHKNGIKTDNRIENLEWVTQYENNLHKCKVLKEGIGEKHGMSKLTNEEIKYIRENYISYDKKFGTLALSKKFNVSQQLISQIINNKTWTHV